MSITLRLVDLIDRLRIQQFFIQKDNKTYFTPISISLNEDTLDKISDKVLRTKGNAYKPNDLEKEVLKELDF